MLAISICAAIPFALTGLGLSDWLTAERLYALIRAALVLVIGLVLARTAAAMVARVARQRTGKQEVMVLRRLTFYPLAALVVLGVLNELGFHLGVLMGAAGLLTVALGFASQTSASNLISGLFLIMERPFVIGDVIRVESITGEVLSIDLLSIKLRTVDNLFVRVPNETILKTQVVNLTHFPIRRLDVMLRVAYKESLAQVRALLATVAAANPLCLTEPEPLYVFQDFGDSALQLQFSVWTRQENYILLKNSINEEIKRAFDAAGIEIPFPQLSLSAWSGLPFPVRVVEER